MGDRPFSPPREKETKESPLFSIKVAGGLGLLSFLLFLTLYLTGIVQPVDLAISETMKNLQSPTVNRLVKSLTMLNSPPALALWSLLLASILLYTRRIRELIFALLAIWGTALATSAVKALVQRSRPTDRIIEISSPSFPSWHASTSMALGFTLMILLYPRYGRRALWILLWPLSIGLSRIYLNAHWTSDVLAGWGLGLFVATIFYLLTLRSRRS